MSVLLYYRTDSRAQCAQAVWSAKHDQVSVLTLGATDNSFVVSGGVNEGDQAQKCSFRNIVAGLLVVRVAEQSSDAGIL